MKAVRLPLSFIPIVVLFFSCGKDEGENMSPADEDLAIQAYLEGEEIDAIADENGIYYHRENVSGNTTQAEGQVLSFYYRESLLSGTVIDVVDSLDPQPVRARQGVNAIYPPGLDIALAAMAEGERWTFIIPSRLAYGAHSYSGIPENAIIKFEVELLKVESEDDILSTEILEITEYIDDAGLRDTASNPLNQPEILSSGVVYKRLSAGQPGVKPASGQEVTLAFKGTFLDGTQFDATPDVAPFRYPFGSDKVIPGLGIGLAKMELDERALIIIPSYLAYRESALVIPSFITPDAVERQIVPPYAAKVGPYRILRFEIDLMGVN